jgi:Carboxypeptidase regulatory-like domain
MMKEHIVCGRLTGGLFEAQSANIGALLIRTGLAISMAVCGFVCTAALHAQIDVRQRSWDGTGCKWRICAGTQVTLHSTDTNTDRVVTTDSTGEFLFSNVNPGHFSITASHEGFSPATLNAISLVSGGLAKVFAIRESVHLRFGVPLSIPHIYKGHSRTFVFFDYEGKTMLLRQRISATQLHSVC